MRDAMVVVIVSECPNAVTRLRHLLTQYGHQCPLDHVASYRTAIDVASSAYPKPDLFLFVVSGPIDDSLECLHRLRESVGACILAIGPRDPSIILGAVRSGAYDYLEEEEDLAGGLAAALTRISESVRRGTALGRVTAVVSASGGTGRTLVAANLAVALAKAHGRCGLFDFDLRGSDVSTFLGMKPRHTVADVCRNVDKLDHNIWEQSLLEHESGVSVLAGPESWDDAQRVTVDALQKIVKFARTVYPQVVLDLDLFSLGDSLPLLLENTTILLLFRLDFASVRNATRIVRHLNKVGIASESVQLAISCYGKHRDISPAQAEAALGLKIRHFVPEDFRIVNASVDCGAPVVVEAPRSPFAKAIVSIAETLPSAETTQTDGVQVEVPASRALAGTLRSFLKLSVRECALGSS
jgi:pilus assembly protein CpaE